MRGLLVPPWIFYATAVPETSFGARGGGKSIYARTISSATGVDVKTIANTWYRNCSFGLWLICLCLGQGKRRFGQFDGQTHLELRRRQKIMRLRLRKVPSGLACFLLLWGTSWAFGQAQVREETRTTTTVRRVSTFIGASVELQAGSTFGRVEDIVINDEGCIDFVVVAFEEKLIAVPFTLTRVDFGRRVVFLNAERDFLLRAPTFTRERFPDLSLQSEFGRRVSTFFRESTNRRGAETRPDRRAPETRPPDRRT